MTDWFIHDAAEGRIGPLDTAAVRERYRQRRITRDTLVWHAGMREWQPLDRVSDVVGIDDVVPDPSLPPPLPPPSSRATPVFAAAPADRPAHVRARAAAPPSRRLSGCAIVAIVVAALSIPMLGILAAIAVPAYQDYTIRARVAGAVTQAIALQGPVLEARRAGRGCPGRGHPALTGALPAGAQVTNLQVGALADGRCAYQVTLVNTHPKVDGQSLLFAMPRDAVGAWECQGSVEDRYLPPSCRAPTAQP